MTRIAKFRAWDYLNDRFIYWELDDIDLSFWREVRVHSFDVEQFTGDYDLNRNEIYEVVSRTV
jgi:hypothetical protein